jgi:hypothetical protein
VMWLMWNLILVRSMMVLVSEQDKCMVCTNRTIGLEIVLEAPDGTPSGRGSSESIVYANHTIGSEIILDTPNGTPR